MVQLLSGLQRVVLIPAGELHGSITLRFATGSSDTCGGGGSMVQSLSGL